MTCCCNQPPACCIGEPVYISLGTLTIGNGTCVSCAYPDGIYCPSPSDFRLIATIPFDCTWQHCCSHDPCFELHDGNPDCAAATPSMLTVLSDEPGTMSGRKLTLEFFQTLPAPCDTARTIARYELDNIDPDLTPCCGIELPKVYDDGTCTFPATVTITCDAEGSCL